VVGDIVLLGDPGVLADMGRQHGALGLIDLGDIDAKVRFDPAPLPVPAADGVHEIEVRNARQRRRRPGPVVTHRGRETGVTDQDARGLMVRVVVLGR